MILQIHIFWGKTAISFNHNPSNSFIESLSGKAKQLFQSHKTMPLVGFSAMKLGRKMGEQ